MFWIHIMLLALDLVGVLLVFYGADATASVWVFAPSIVSLILLIVMVPNTYKRWREARSNLMI